MDNLPIGLHAYNKFMKFRNHQLIIIKRKYNLGTEEFEDIFQDAIIVAIKKFDNERGEFDGFFSTVFENRVRNYLRDIRLRIMLTKIDTYENIEELEEEAIDDSEFLDYFKSIEHFSNSLKKKLSESESTFFDELKNVVVDNPQGFVSITSRNLGMEPNKGWDVWRRVQRKITQLLNEKKAEQDVIGVRDKEKIYSLESPMHDRSAIYFDKVSEVRKNYPLLNFLSASDIQRLLSYFE
ncbi:MAG: hypothetical protein IPG02_00900 [Ignavibacteria bacterium]|nr:hypothetical protein [Ignavibacteria bacterium]